VPEPNTFFLHTGGARVDEPPSQFGPWWCQKLSDIGTRKDLNSPLVALAQLASVLSADGHRTKCPSTWGISGAG